ncbi:MAG: DUF4126 domain-containing protein, partial [Pirellulales bacterium]
TAATPVAVVAGTIVAASQIVEVSPLLQWSLAAIAGGGVCGIIQGGTVALRAASTGATGGAGNFVVSTLEAVASLVVTVLAVVVPIFCIILVLLTCYKMLTAIARLAARRRQRAAG